MLFCAYTFRWLMRSCVHIYAESVRAEYSVNGLSRMAGAIARVFAIIDIIISDHLERRSCGSCL